LLKGVVLSSRQCTSVPNGTAACCILLRQRRLTTIHTRHARTCVYPCTQGCQAQLPAPIKVVGCGSCGVDYLASVAAFPQPDQKLRTDTLEVQGGGNCANALTAAARLGLSPTIVTKVGAASSCVSTCCVASCRLVGRCDRCRTGLCALLPPSPRRLAVMASATAS
jgi:hypothetical protein